MAIDMNRLSELTSMRAPNQSGVDMAGLVQALAGAGAGAQKHSPHAYGLRPDEAMALSASHQQVKNDMYDKTMQAVNGAMAQNSQLFDEAYKAHGMAINERQLALSEKVSQAEIAYKQASMSGIAENIKNARLQGLQLEKNLAAEEALSSFSVAIKNPKAGSQVIGSDGQPLFDEKGVPTLEPPTRQMPANVWKAAGGNITALLGISDNPKIRQLNSTFIGMGFSEDGAASLSLMNPDVVNKNAMDFGRKLLSETKGYSGNYALPNINDPRTGIMRTMTPEEFIRHKAAEYADNVLGTSLSPDDRARLNDMYVNGVSDLGMPDNKDMDSLVQVFLEAMSKQEK